MEIIEVWSQNGEELQMFVGFVFSQIIYNSQKDIKLPLTKISTAFQNLGLNLRVLSYSGTPWRHGIANCECLSRIKSTFANSVDKFIDYSNLWHLPDHPQRTKDSSWTWYWARNKFLLRTWMKQRGYSFLVPTLTRHHILTLFLGAVSQVIGAYSKCKGTIQINFGIEFLSRILIWQL